LLARKEKPSTQQAIGSHLQQVNGGCQGESVSRVLERKHGFAILRAGHRRLASDCQGFPVVAVVHHCVPSWHRQGRFPWIHCLLACLLRCFFNLCVHGRGVSAVLLTLPIGNSHIGVGGRKQRAVIDTRASARAGDQAAGRVLETRHLALQTSRQAPEQCRCRLQLLTVAQGAARLPQFWIASDPRPALRWFSQRECASWTHRPAPWPKAAFQLPSPFSSAFSAPAGAFQAQLWPVSRAA